MFASTCSDTTDKKSAVPKVDDLEAPALEPAEIVVEEEQTTSADTSLVEDEAIEAVAAPDEIASVDLNRCLEQLEPAQSKAILMAFHFGFSHAELAKTFAVPLGTMKSTIRRGLIRLKECLDRGDAVG